MPLKQQFILVLIWPIIASILSLYFQATFFLSIILYLGFPAIFLTLLHPKFFKKILIAAFVGLPLGIAMDYMMQSTNQWYIPNPVLNFWKPFGYVVLDNIFWFFSYLYFVILYYEIFIEKDKKVKNLYPQTKILFFIMSILIAGFVWLYFVNPNLLMIDYLYFKFGLICVLIPTILVLFRFPKLWARFFKAGAYFFYLSAIYEITGLTLNQWTFPGNHYIGFIEIFNLRFPFEEFFFWITLGALGVLSFYEYFDDDPR